MEKQSPSSLREALDFRLSEILRYDFYIALVGLVGGILAEVESIASLPLLIAVAAGLVGVIIGAVIAGVGCLSGPFWKFVGGGFRVRACCQAGYSQALGSLRYRPQAVSRASSGVPTGMPLGSAAS